MESPTNFKFPATPSLPLLPLSPERVNARSGQHAQSDHDVFNTPIPSDSAALKHAHTHSDVQSMVARFNHLDIKDHAELRKKDEAALKRAQMGREDAEEQLKKSRDEVSRLKDEAESAADRERRVTKRLDAVMDDFLRTKESSAHAQNLYEKEIRKARKEAFKSSSILVKLQEDLKASRAATKTAQADATHERLRAERREQEAFAAKYELVGIQELLNKAQTQAKVLEEEKQALKMALKEEEVAHIAAAGGVALPTAFSDDDEFASPRKSPPKATGSQETFPISIDNSKLRLYNSELSALRQELEEHRRARCKAEDTVHFLKLECQYGCCSCRLAERRGISFVHDSLVASNRRLCRSLTSEVATNAESQAQHTGPPPELADCLYTGSTLEPNEQQLDEDRLVRLSQHRTKSSGRGNSSEQPHTLEDTGVTIPPNIPPPNLQEDVPTSFLHSIGSSHKAAAHSSRHAEHYTDSSESPQPDVLSPVGTFRTTTVTTKIPLAPLSSPIKQKIDPNAVPGATGNHLVAASGCESVTSDSFERTNTDNEGPRTVFPGTPLTREEAIARLRERRGRERARTNTTQGMNLQESTGAPGFTPKRAVSQGHRLTKPNNTTAQSDRRDISAPEIAPRSG